MWWIDNFVWWHVRSRFDRARFPFVHKNLFYSRVPLSTIGNKNFLSPSLEISINKIFTDPFHFVIEVLMSIRHHLTMIERIEVDFALGSVKKSENSTVEIFSTTTFYGVQEKNFWSTPKNVQISKFGHSTQDRNFSSPEWANTCWPEFIAASHLSGHAKRSANRSHKKYLSRRGNLLAKRLATKVDVIRS